MGFPGTILAAYTEGMVFIHQQNPAPNLVHGNSALVHIGKSRQRLPLPEKEIYTDGRSVLYISPLEFKFK